MANRKSFTALQPAEAPEIEINGEVFHLRPAIPGDVLLDFLSEADTEDPAALSKTVRNLMQAAIAPEDIERWTAFIRDPDNNVTLNLLSEIAGYMAEALSGNDQGKQLLPSSVG